MTYANYQDYIEEYGSDDLPEDSETRVARAIQRASRLIDTYIRASGLTVPLTDSVTINDVRGSVLDIARYFSWPDNSSDEIRKRYEDAIAFLEKISAGKIKLVSSSQETSSNIGFKNIRLVRA